MAKKLFADLGGPGHTLYYMGQSGAANIGMVDILRFSKPNSQCWMRTLPEM